MNARHSTHPISYHQRKKSIYAIPEFIASIPGKKISEFWNCAAYHRNCQANGCILCCIEDAE